MKRPILYYFTLLISLTLSFVVTIYLGKFLMNFLWFKSLYIEYISKIILLLFLFIQYLLYKKFNKKEDEFFEIKHQSGNYYYLDKRNNFLSDFYQGNNPVPLKVHILGLSLFFLYIMTFIGSNLQILIYPFVKNITLFKDSGIIYFESLKNLIKQNLILSFLLIVFIGPIIEELTFRGFSLSVKFQKFSRLIVTIFFSFIFSIIHWDFSRVLAIFIMGFALGLVYNLTESLIYPIVIHIVNNGISFFALYSILQRSDFTKLTQLIDSRFLITQQKSNSSFTISILIFFLTILASYIYRKIKSLVSEELPQKD